jgi:23S rRNA pseudouridine1911/1915/1917 synthase
VGNPDRPGIVHRLDKETSGVIVVAKTNESHRKLVKQFKKREIEKTYLAIVHGSFEEEEGIIDMPIGRDRKRRKKMTVTVKSGKTSVTKFKVKGSLNGLSLLEIHPKTGRTHQIRVHLSQIGHPILGDYKYGKSSEKIDVKRFMLHAKSIKLTHPRSQRKEKFTTPLPEDFKFILKSLDS